MRPAWCAGTDDPSWNWVQTGAGGGLGIAKNGDTLRAHSGSYNMSAGDWCAHTPRLLL